MRNEYNYTKALIPENCSVTAIIKDVLQKNKIKIHIIESKQKIFFFNKSFLNSKINKKIIVSKKFSIYYFLNLN